MAWTAPMTFTDGVPLTAAQLNTHLRDNLLETAPAKASTPGSLFVTTGPNQISERQFIHALGSQVVSTSSTSYENVEGGPSITVETGTSALVWISAGVMNSNTVNQSLMSVAVSGATSIEAVDQISIRLSGDRWQNTANFHVFHDLQPGENTFTAQVRVSAGTGTFMQRRLTVLPL